MKLETVDLFKSFGDKSVLKGVSLKAESGRALGLLGRNGAGKTTAIRIIMRVFPPDSGAVLLDGMPFDTGKIKIGYLPEERGLYPKKPILEQLIYFGRLNGLSRGRAVSNADRLLERLNMTEYRTKRLDTLSKGNQQKIQLVATLIADPDIVILDEPFSGLDPVNAMLLKELVKELIKDGKIVLFSSHQMNYVEEFCDEIAILNDGKIVLSGSIEEIKRSCDRRNIEIVSYDAEKAEQFIKSELSDIVSKTELNGNKLVVTLLNENGKEKLYKSLGGLSGSFDYFKVKEPTLNEIFVNYTEGTV